MGDRGDTYQPQGYLHDNKGQEIEMRNYPETSSHPQPKNDQHQTHSLESAKEEESSMGGYVLHWVAFLIAMGLNLGIWALDTYVIKRQYSYYYYNSMTFSESIDTTSYTSGTQMFSPDDPNDTLGVTMGLIYGWVLWKLPLVVYLFHLTS